MVEIIKIFPNPEGKEQGQEWIKIKNNSSQDENISNWEIKNSSNKIYHFPNYKIIKSGETISLSDSQTKIILKNNGDKICLLNSKQEEINCGEYLSAAEGKILTNWGGIFSENEPIAQTNLVTASSGNILNKNSDSTVIIFGVIIALTLGLLAIYFSRIFK